MYLYEFGRHGLNHLQSPAAPPAQPAASRPAAAHPRDSQLLAAAASAEAAGRTQATPPTPHQPLESSAPIALPASGSTPELRAGPADATAGPSAAQPGCAASSGSLSQTPDANVAAAAAAARQSGVAPEAGSGGLGRTSGDLQTAASGSTRQRLKERLRRWAQQQTAFLVGCKHAAAASLAACLTSALATHGSLLTLSSTHVCVLFSDACSVLF